MLISALFSLIFLLIYSPPSTHTHSQFFNFTLSLIFKYILTLVRRWWKGRKKEWNSLCDCLWISWTSEVDVKLVEIFFFIITEPLNISICVFFYWLKSFSIVMASELLDRVRLNQISYMHGVLFACMMTQRVKFIIFHSLYFYVNDAKLILAMKKISKKEYLWEFYKWWGCLYIKSANGY